MHHIALKNNRTKSYPRTLQIELERIILNIQAIRPAKGIVEELPPFDIPWCEVAGIAFGTPHAFVHGNPKQFVHGARKSAYASGVQDGGSQGTAYQDCHGAGPETAVSHSVFHARARASRHAAKHTMPTTTVPAGEIAVRYSSTGPMGDVRISDIFSDSSALRVSASTNDLVLPPIA